MSCPLTVVPASIPDVRVISTTWFEDERGRFSEIYSRGALAASDIGFDLVQENLAVSHAVGTVRGLHYQRVPFSQAKLVRVVKGAIFDVAVDLRKGSPWFGRWAAVELSASNRRQILVPKGFAHGYCTLEADTEVVYAVDVAYAPQSEAGIFWNDPQLGIPWPIAPEQAVIADRDRMLPRIADVDADFVHDGGGA